MWYLSKTVAMNLKHNCLSIKVLFVSFWQEESLQTDQQHRFTHSRLLSVTNQKKYRVSCNCFWLQKLKVFFPTNCSYCVFQFRKNSKAILDWNPFMFAQSSGPTFEKMGNEENTWICLDLKEQMFWKCVHWTEYVASAAFVVLSYFCSFCYICLNLEWILLQDFTVKIKIKTFTWQRAN